MAYGESNAHVTDDVMWPRKVKVVTQLCLRTNISKTLGDAHLVTMEHLLEMAAGETNGHVTPKGQNRNPDIGQCKYFENGER